MNKQILKIIDGNNNIALELKRLIKNEDEILKNEIEIDNYEYYYVYDENGNKTYFEDGEGYWVKWKYDEKGSATCC